MFSRSTPEMELEQENERLQWQVESLSADYQELERRTDALQEKAEETIIKLNLALRLALGYAGQLDPGIKEIPSILDALNSESEYWAWIRGNRS